MAVCFENGEVLLRVAERAVQAYPFERAAAELLSFSENATYLIFDPETREKLCVLRVGRPGYHVLEEYESEIRWLRQISETTSLEVARPLAARDGSCVQVVDGAEVEGGDGRVSYFCVATEFLAGRTLECDDEPGTSAEHFCMLGEITAHLHQQVATWDGAKDLKRVRWDCEGMIGPRAVWGNWREYPGVTSDQEKKIARCCEVIRTRLERYGKTEQNYGIIHADLREANVIVEGGVLKVIDFDDFGFGWHLHDLASALTFIEDREDAPDLVNAWLEGYRRVLSLSAADIAEVDTFIVQRRIQIMAWMGSHQDSAPAQDHASGYVEGTMKLVERYLERFG